MEVLTELLKDSISDMLPDLVKGSDRVDMSESNLLLVILFEPSALVVLELLVSVVISLAIVELSPVVTDTLSVVEMVIVVLIAELLKSELKADVVMLSSVLIYKLVEEVAE